MESGGLFVFCGPSAHLRQPLLLKDVHGQFVVPFAVQKICLTAAACLAETGAFVCRNGARIEAEHMKLYVVQVQRFKAIAQQQAQHLLAIALAAVCLVAQKQPHLPQRRFQSISLMPQLPISLSPSSSTMANW